MLFREAAQALLLAELLYLVCCSDPRGCTGPPPHWTVIFCMFRSARLHRPSSWLNCYILFVVQIREAAQALLWLNCYILFVVQIREAAQAHLWLNCYILFVVQIHEAAQALLLTELLYFVCCSDPRGCTGPPPHWTVIFCLLFRSARLHRPSSWLNCYIWFVQIREAAQALLLAELLYLVCSDPRGCTGPPPGWTVIFGLFRSARLHRPSSWLNCYILFVVQIREAAQALLLTELIFCLLFRSARLHRPSSWLNCYIWFVQIREAAQALLLAELLYLVCSDPRGCTGPPPGWTVIFGLFRSARLHRPSSWLNYYIWFVQILEAAQALLLAELLYLVCLDLRGCTGPPPGWTVIFGLFRSARLHRPSSWLNCYIWFVQIREAAQAFLLAELLYLVCSDPRGCTGPPPGWTVIFGLFRSARLHRPSSWLNCYILFVCSDPRGCTGPPPHWTVIFCLFRSARLHRPSSWLNCYILYVQIREAAQALLLTELLYFVCSDPQGCTGPPPGWTVIFCLFRSARLHRPSSSLNCYILFVQIREAAQALLLTELLYFVCSDQRGCTGPPPHWTVIFCMFRSARLHRPSSSLNCYILFVQIREAAQALLLTELLYFVCSDPRGCTGPPPGWTASYWPWGQEGDCRRVGTVTADVRRSTTQLVEWLAGAARWGGRWRRGWWADASRWVQHQW